MCFDSFPLTLAVISVFEFLHIYNYIKKTNFTVPMCERPCTVSFRLELLGGGAPLLFFQLASYVTYDAFAAAARG